MPKLKNPFAKFQAEKQANRGHTITRFLSTLRRTRAKYQYVTDLAKAVAEQIELTEKKPCSPSTLLRNKHYKVLLLHFMATQPGTDHLSINSVTDNTAKLLLNAAELDVGNLKRENERLHSYVKSLEKRLDECNNTSTVLLPIMEEGDAEHELDNLRINYALVCKSLWLVLDHFKGVLMADADGQRIIDLAAPRRKNVIVDADAAAPFFDWLLRNKEISQ